MNILAIDTSTQACSAALQIGDELFSEFQMAPMQHAKLILPMIDGLLSKAHVRLKELDAMAFSAGPGSFTGLRVAAGVIQGLAFGSGLPVVPVSTLAVLAQGAFREFKATKILPALDARMNQVYTGIYEIEQDFVRPLTDDQVINPEQVSVPQGKAWCGVGEGWAAYYNILQERLQNHINEIHDNLYPHAQDIIPLALKKLEQGLMVPPHQALPVYLREKVV